MAHGLDPMEPGSAPASSGGDSRFVGAAGRCRPKDAGRGYAQVPDETEYFEYSQDVVGDIDLPPEESLPCRCHVVMMIVMPAFSQGEKGEKEVVATVVAGFVALTPPTVGQ